MTSQHPLTAAPVRRTVVAISLAAAGLLVGFTACAKEETKTEPTTTTAAEAKSKDTKPASPGTTTKRPGTTLKSTAKTEPTGTVDESTLPEWQRTATPYIGQIGETFDFECTPGGEAHNVWGTNLYTADSSVCTAAVQVGLIDFEDGGTVTIVIEEGAEEYTGAVVNGVESLDYGSWEGSFAFPDATPVEFGEGIAWSRPGNYYTGKTGTITVVCEPGGEPGSVWGTEIYTDDSSICTAAVHAGLIDFADGGEVAFELAPGQESYTGSTANGVTSSDYGSWGGSFSFVD